MFYCYCFFKLKDIQHFILSLMCYFIALVFTHADLLCISVCLLSWSSLTFPRCNRCRSKCHCSHWKDPQSIKQSRMHYNLKQHVLSPPLSCWCKSQRVFGSLSPVPWQMERCGDKPSCHTELHDRSVCVRARLFFSLLLASR